jgi:hypothetical protein
VAFGLAGALYGLTRAQRLGPCLPVLEALPRNWRGLSAHVWRFPALAAPASAVNFWVGT